MTDKPHLPEWAQDDEVHEFHQEVLRRLPKNANPGKAPSIAAKVLWEMKQE